MARKTGSHSEITGPRIRSAARTLFARHGFAAVSMRQIAAAVGVQAGALYLYTTGRPGAAIGLVLFGGIVVGNIDNLIRPMISNRYAQIHPLITLVGAIAGVSYIGLLGLLVGPLALSYFFELLTMYRREYLRPVVSTG